MDPKMYPVGNQSISSADIETSPTVTDLIETIDASNTNERKFISLTNLATLTVAGVTASAAEINKNAGVTGGVATASKTVVLDANKAVAGIVNPTTTVDAGATTPLTAADSGRVIIINSTDDHTITLPATVAGVTYRVFVKTPAAGGKLLSISPVAADKIIAKGLSGVDNKDLQHTQATAALGDGVVLIGDGVDGWLAILTGTWAIEAP